MNVFLRHPASNVCTFGGSLKILYLMLPGNLVQVLGLENYSHKTLWEQQGLLKPVENNLFREVLIELKNEYELPDKCQIENYILKKEGAIEMRVN